MNRPSSSFSITWGTGKLSSNDNSVTLIGDSSGSGDSIKTIEMTGVERSSGILHTNYYGAVTFRLLGVLKR